METEIMFAWLSGLMVTLSILAWWFDTRLAVHLFCALRQLGWRKRDEEFWSIPTSYGPRTPVGSFTRADLDGWMGEKFPHLAAELLSCPGCLSAHVAFWVSAGVQMAAGPHTWLFLAGWLGWPGAALFLRSLRGSKG